MSKKPLNWMQKEDLRKAADEVARELAAIPSFKHDSAGRDAYAIHVDQMAERLEGFGLTIKDDWNGAIVRMHGVRSTSTTGVVGALHNWHRAAKARLA